MIITNDGLSVSAKKRNDLDRIKESFKKEINAKEINAKDSDGYTLLHLAAKYDYLNVVEKLLKKGADVNARNNNDDTPLHLAAKYGRLNIVEKLIEKGADVNARNNNGDTPLYFAAINGHLNVVEKLIEKGADVNARNNNDDIPLHLAAKYGHSNVVEKLLEKGADVKNNNGNTPLHEAAITGHSNVVEKLIERGADINARNNDGDTPLHEAAIIGYLNLVEKLIEKGADINARNNNGDTPLHLAAKYGHLNVVEKLIEKGADINARNNNDDTPLHWAVKNGHLEVAEFLISKHADVNAKNKDDWTPFHLAAARANLNIVKFILDKRNDVDAIGALTVANTLSKENSSEILNLLEERIRKNEEMMQLKLQEHISFLPTNVHNCCNIAQEDENSLQNDKIGPNKIGVTSGTSKPSSFINIFAHTVVDTTKGIFQFASSHFKAAISMEPSKAITVQGIDNNGMLLLLDILIRKITGQKYISTVVQSIPPLEAQDYALNIIEEFEKVVEQAALKSDISMHRLNIDYIEMKKEVTAKIMGGKFNEISEVLSSYVEKACPGIEAGCPGKLSSKKFDKFMVEFNSRLNVVLGQPMQQMLHNRLEVSDEQINSAPQSYLSNTSVQGHITQDKVKLIYYREC